MHKQPLGHFYLASYTRVSAKQEEQTGAEALQEAGSALIHTGLSKVPLSRKGLYMED